MFFAYVDVLGISVLPMLNFDKKQNFFNPRQLQDFANKTSVWFLEDGRAGHMWLCGWDANGHLVGKQTRRTAPSEEAPFVLLMIIA